MHSWQNSYRAFRLLKSDSSSVVSIWPIHSATGWNKIRIQLWKMEWQELQCDGTFNGVIFIFHDRKWRQMFEPIRSFDVISVMKCKEHIIFSVNVHRIQVLFTPFFRIGFRSPKSILCRFIYFQPVALDIHYAEVNCSDWTLILAYTRNRRRYRNRNAIEIFRYSPSRIISVRPTYWFPFCRCRIRKP